MGEKFWQSRYDSFEMYADEKLREKREHMHLKPLCAGFLEQAVDWRWSYARHEEQGLPVGLPVDSIP